MRWYSWPHLMAFALQASLLVRHSAPAVGRRILCHATGRRLGASVRHHAAGAGYPNDREPRPDREVTPIPSINRSSSRSSVVP
jgi:hypothetical protein